MILLTGDSGFIGSFLAASLFHQGCTVRGIDLIARNNSHLHYEQYVGNILDKELVHRAMCGVDCVFHLAAEHRDFGISRDEYYEVNVGGTQVLLDTASIAGIKKFVLFSSVAVYGNCSNASEESLPSPVNAYGQSKLEAEQRVRKWVEEDRSRQAVIVRPTVVFGPRNRANIFKLIQYVCDGKFIWVGKGDAVKSIAYVENLVEATFYLMNDMKPGVAIFNYVDEPQMTTRELVMLIAQKAGVAPPTISIPLGIALPAAKLFDLVGTLTHRDFSISTHRIQKFNTPTRYDSRKIRSLGFKPPSTIEQGIEKNVQWYKEQVQLIKEPAQASFEE